MQGATDIDVGTPILVIAEEVRTTRFDLLERLGGHLLDMVMDDPMVLAAEVRIAKPSAPIPEELDEVAVVLRRTR